MKLVTMDAEEQCSVSELRACLCVYVRERERERENTLVHLTKI